MLVAFQTADPFIVSVGLMKLKKYCSQFLQMLLYLSSFQVITDMLGFIFHISGQSGRPSGLFYLR